MTVTSKHLYLLNCSISKVTERGSYEVTEKSKVATESQALGL